VLSAGRHTPDAVETASWLESGPTVHRAASKYNQSLIGTSHLEPRC